MFPIRFALIRPACTLFLIQLGVAAADRIRVCWFFFVKQPFTEAEFSAWKKVVTRIPTMRKIEKEFKRISRQAMVRVAAALRMANLTEQITLRRFRLGIRSVLVHCGGLRLVGKAALGTRRSEDHQYHR